MKKLRKVKLLHPDCAHSVASVVHPDLGTSVTRADHRKMTSSGTFRSTPGNFALSSA